jgi:hypothetical protein
MTSAFILSGLLIAVELYAKLRIGACMADCIASPTVTTINEYGCEVALEISLRRVENETRVDALSESCWAADAERTKLLLTA